MKLLLTSIGRRVELVQAFRNAAERLNEDLHVVGADMSLTAPALYFCDEAVRVSRIHDKNYIPQLVDICKERKIDCLIPTIDTELLILAQSKSKFEAVGTRVLVSDVERIALCRDKRKTADYFKQIGLNTPVPVDKVADYADGFPAFIKPLDGSSSINAYKVQNKADLAAYANLIPDYIIQPFISGREFTIDIFCDFTGNPIFITPRERLAVRSGEVLKTKIYQNKVIIDEMKHLVKDFKPCGQITVQLIHDDISQKNYYIEINPRFGGGAPLSMKAGADSAAALIRLLKGEALSYMECAARNGLHTADSIKVFVLTKEVKAMIEVCSVLDVEKYSSEFKLILFDLDDTLYSEKDYVRSGFSQVANLFPERNEAEARLWTFFLENRPAIDCLLTERHITDANFKERCLQVYRFHRPQISLYPGVREMLLRMREQKKKLGLITDGRPEGQQAKIDALKIRDVFDKIIVTDELGGTSFRKPNPKAFELMAEWFGASFESMCYVGDNKTKDFDAPEKLGMHLIWFRNPDGIYKQAKN